MSGIANELPAAVPLPAEVSTWISHALDKILEVPQLHGIQVGIATYIMAKRTGSPLHPCQHGT